MFVNTKKSWQQYKRWPGTEGENELQELSKRVLQEE